MAYVRSVREIPINEDPIASALTAVLPDPDESPVGADLRWDNVTTKQAALLLVHPGAAAIIGSGAASSGELGQPATITPIS